MDFPTDDVMEFPIDVTNNNTAVINRQLSSGEEMNENDGMLLYGFSMRCMLMNTTGCRDPPVSVSVADYSVAINGYLSTVLVLFTLLTNCLVCIVLMRRHMRTPTNALLVAMAVSTTLTGVCPIPSYIYFYVLGHYGDWVPYSWCFVNHLLTDHLPTIFHTASIWITVALAVQRYLTVCQSSDTSKRWCTVRTVVRVVVIIHVVAFACQLCRMLELQYVPVEFQSRIDPRRNVTACYARFVEFVAENENLYFGVYYCTRVVFMHILPCFALALLNSLLVRAMRSAQARRRHLLTQHRKSESRRVAESNSTTWMLVAVVCVFLLVEFPLAIVFLLLVADNTFELTVFNPNSTNKASEVINLLILFSYPINFFIYCGMSKQFRETFKGLFKTATVTPPTSMSTVTARRHTLQPEGESKKFGSKMELTQL